GGRGGGFGGGGARTSISGARPGGGFGGGARPSGGFDGGARNNNIAGNRDLSNVSGNRNINNISGNRDINNISGNRNWNTDIDVDNGWGGAWGVGAGVVAGAAITAAAIGSVVYTLPPSCSTNWVNNVAYQSCGGVWYEPSFSGSSVSYTVVDQP
ncbi:MAG TPA: hypothetical protein VKA54_12390, partial [Gemmatimonadaceae bacterium]|nr:hypothetical protein [Gemmatimonadaceae bacterium]